MRLLLLLPYGEMIPGYCGDIATTARQSVCLSAYKYHVSCSLARYNVNEWIPSQILDPSYVHIQGFIIAAEYL